MVNLDNEIEPYPSNLIIVTNIFIFFFSLGLYPLHSYEFFDQMQQSL